MVRRWYDVGTAQIGGWYTHGGPWGGGASRFEEPPPPTGTLGRALRGMPPTIICAHVGIKGNGERRITTQHAASLRPPRKRENRF